MQQQWGRGPNHRRTHTYAGFTAAACAAEEVVKSCCAWPCARSAPLYRQQAPTASRHSGSPGAGTRPTAPHCAPPHKGAGRPPAPALCTQGPRRGLRRGVARRRSRANWRAPLCLPARNIAVDAETAPSHAARKVHSQRCSEPPRQTSRWRRTSGVARCHDCRRSFAFPPPPRARPRSPRRQAPSPKPRPEQHPRRRGGRGGDNPHSPACKALSELARRPPSPSAPRMPEPALLALVPLLPPLRLPAWGARPKHKGGGAADAGGPPGRRPRPRPPGTQGCRGE
mmetsp:Transcript_7678/g.17568  ORF Transcript_7678/g.17568 Transcript_7678/m.17568 type:complete len:283 (+) Transcript_7678:70-918(+)